MLTNKRQTKNFIDAYLQYTGEDEPPTIFKKWVAISTVAAAMQRKCIYKVGNLETYCNLYTILVGVAAVGKGVAMRPARNMLLKNGIKIGAECSTRVGLIQELMDSNSKASFNINGEPHWHSSLTIFSPEFEVFVSQGDTQFRGIITDLYDCGIASGNAWTYKTSKDNRGDEKIEFPWLNILGGTTPDILQSMSTTEVVHGGLSSRIIFVYASKKSQSIAFPEYGVKQENLHKKLEDDLMSIFLMSGFFKLTEEFKESFNIWYNINDNPENYPLKDDRFYPYCGRRGLHLRKLSMIVSAARSSEMIITKEDFNIALSYLLEVEKDMIKVFGGMGLLGTEGLMLHKIEEYIELHDEVTIERLMNQYGFDISYDSLIRILIVLKKQGKIDYIRQTREGKTVNELVRWLG